MLRENIDPSQLQENTEISGNAQDTNQTEGSTNVNNATNPQEDKQDSSLSKAYQKIYELQANSNRLKDQKFKFDNQIFHKSDTSYTILASQDQSLEEDNTHSNTETNPQTDVQAPNLSKDEQENFNEAPAEVEPIKDQQSQPEKQLDHTVNQEAMVAPAQEPSKIEDNISTPEVTNPQTKEQELNLSKEYQEKILGLQSQIDLIKNQKTELEKQQSELEDQQLEFENQLANTVNKEEFLKLFNELFDKKSQEGLEASSFSKNALEKLNTMIGAQVKLTEAQREVELDALIKDQEAMSTILKKYIYPSERLSQEMIASYSKLIDKMAKEHSVLISEQLEQFEKDIYDKKKQFYEVIKATENAKNDFNILSANFSEKQAQEALKLAKLDSKVKNQAFEIEVYKRRISELEDIEKKHKDLCLSVGDQNPELAQKIVDELRAQNQELKSVIEHLPGKEIETEYEKVKAKLKSLEEFIETKKESFLHAENCVNKYDDLQIELDKAKSTIVSKDHAIHSLEGSIKLLQDSLDRYKTPKGQEIDYNQRLSQIEKPEIVKKEAYEFDLYKDEKDYTEEEKELKESKWLENLQKNIKAQGFKFSDRIIKSFHTSLKIARFSPLTVLAGVSGTGKSELPRLYSKFGGINFLSLAVQPNWDSQESMLGFYNPVENCFEAKPVLRLLAQTQKEINDSSDNDEYSLKDQLTIILLDEMNLSHVELYFADFLSKFETRRDKDVVSADDKDLCLNVNLGSGFSFGIPLDYNVLWVGTMNQDETTKSLSDKVLDRGIIINFPRPKILQSRSLSRAVTSQNSDIKMLPRDVWFNKWVVDTNYLEDELTVKYRKHVQKINKYMSNAGRALGHRVWQSIEYYMLNYPDVLACYDIKDVKNPATFKFNENKEARNKALDIAFEDQIVQKIMPKLRGIETRGIARRECLDKIKELIAENYPSLLEDFNNACNNGYGQFQWNSANYLDDDEEEE